MLVALILIETTDLIFALDSIRPCSPSPADIALWYARPGSWCRIRQGMNRATHVLHTAQLCLTNRCSALSPNSRRTVAISSSAANG
jgi:hypothetical protein